MAKIKKLNEDQEQEITVALTDVADLVKSGASPDDAIVKVAAEKQLPAGYVRLMTNAYNTGQSLGAIRNGKTLTEKAGSFPLANAVNILERLFPSDVKTAAEVAMDESVSSDYDLPPHYWLAQRKQQVKQANVAKVQANIAAGMAPEEAVRAAYPAYTPDQDAATVAQISGGNKVAEYGCLPEKPGKKAVKKLRKLKKDAEQKRLDAVSAGYRVTGSLDDLTNYFRKVGHLSLDVVRKNAEAVIGPKVNGLLNKVDEQRGKLAKNAEDNSAHNVNWNAAPYSLITETLDAIENFKEIKIALDRFEKEAEADAVEIVRPFCGTGEQPVIKGSVWDHRSQKEANILPIALGASLGGAGKEIVGDFADTDDDVMEMAGRIGSREHEDTLRRIQTKTMLNDMLANDPVISGYDQDRTLDAFNHLNQLAPRALSQRLVAQQMMRKYLEQDSAVDPFDVDQLLEIEKKLQQRDNPKMPTPGK